MKSKTPTTETYCTAVKPFIIHRHSFLIMRSGTPAVAIDRLLKVFLKFVGFNVHVFSRGVKFTNCELFQLIKPYLFPDCGAKAKRVLVRLMMFFAGCSPSCRICLLYTNYIRFNLIVWTTDFDSMIVNLPMCGQA